METIKTPACIITLLIVVASPFAVLIGGALFVRRAFENAAAEKWQIDAKALGLEFFEKPDVTLQGEYGGVLVRVNRRVEVRDGLLRLSYQGNVHGSALRERLDTSTAQARIIDGLAEVS